MDGENNGKPNENGWFGGKTHHFRNPPIISLCPNPCILPRSHVVRLQGTEFHHCRFPPKIFTNSSPVFRDHFERNWIIFQPSIFKGYYWWFRHPAYPGLCGSEHLIIQRGFKKTSQVVFGDRISSINSSYCSFLGWKFQISNDPGITQTQLGILQKLNIQVIL